MTDLNILSNKIKRHCVLRALFINKSRLLLLLIGTIFYPRHDHICPLFGWEAKLKLRISFRRGEASQSFNRISLPHQMRASPGRCTGTKPGKDETMKKFNTSV